jgi:hypothetical protein
VTSFGAFVLAWTNEAYMDPEATIEASAIDFWSNAVPMEWKVFRTASHQLPVPRSPGGHGRATHQSRSLFCER